MISVNSLIDNAFKRTSFVGDGETVSPTQSAAGLYELQSLISELNTEDFLLENYHTYDVDAAEKIKFAVKPDHWYEVDSLMTSLREFLTTTITWTTFTSSRLRTTDMSSTVFVHSAQVS